MINKVILVGHVGQEPEIRSLNGGKEIASFSLATSKRWKDKTSGERKEKTEWHRIVVFNTHLIPVVRDYVRKGSKLYIEGELVTRKWEDDSGTTRYSSEINLSFNGQIVLCDRSEGGAWQNTPPDDVYEGEY